MKPLTGRFTSEELACFRRVRTPSSKCTSKAEGCKSLPTLRGKFAKFQIPQDGNNQSMQILPRRHIGKTESWPDEFMTAKVLDEIYPRTPPRIDDFESFSLQSPLCKMTNLTPTAHSDDEARKALRFNRGNGLSPDRLLSTPPGTPAPEPITSSHKASSPIGSSKNFEALSHVPCQGIGQDLGLAAGAFVTPLAAMIAFRRLLIKRFHNMDEAIRLLCSELEHPDIMTRKDFRLSLQHLALDLSKETREAVFKHLDIRGDGVVSMSELDIAVQAASPVRNLSDLRCRWLAAGYRSLSQCVRAVQDTGKPLCSLLTLREFGEVLSALQVTEHEEHVALFNIIADSHERSGRVAMTDLIAALATQSPSMLLEDLHNYLHRKYAGNFERAFTDLDQEHLGALSTDDFVEKAVARFGLQDHEARKVFRQIDVAGCGRICRVDFLRAINVSAPSLFLEDLRRKVLQRFRSIQMAFRKALAEDTAQEKESSALLSLAQIHEILLAADLTEEDVTRLFNVIDVDGHGALTVAEFVRGTLQFAPSWALEEFRLQCVCKHGRISEAFGNLDIPHSNGLDLHGFSNILEELDCKVDAVIIFDILDVLHDGQTTLGRFIAALQAGGPGSAQKLSDEERDSYAKHDVRGCTSNVHRLVGDFKTEVLQGVDDAGKNSFENSAVLHDSSREEVSPMKNGTCRKAIARKAVALCGGGASNETDCADGGRLGAHNKCKIKKHWTTGHRGILKAGSDEGKRDKLQVKSPAPARLRTTPLEDIRFYVVHQAAAPAAGPPKPFANSREEVFRTPSQNTVIDNQKSWSSVWKRLNTASGYEDRQSLEREIHSYYQTATDCLSHDVPLLEKAHSRFALHANVRKHN